MPLALLPDFLDRPDARSSRAPSDAGAGFEAASPGAEKRLRYRGLVPIRDQKELRLLLVVVGGFLLGFGLLLFMIATDV